MYDLCIIGSGAGAAPLIYEFTKAGKSVAVIEKGKHYKRDDFSKDEIAYTKRDIFTPSLQEEYHTIVKNKRLYSSFEADFSFWNGSLVGGSSNFMSGYFHRLDSDDFRLLSKYGAIEGANIVDWPIDSHDMQKYYDKVERLVGVSGLKSPYPPTLEHSISKLIDTTAKDLCMDIKQTKRAILTKNMHSRESCYYSNYCGSYGCSSGAKGSALEALINPVLGLKNLTLLCESFAIRLIEKNNNVDQVVYIDTKTQKQHKLQAKLFIVACGAIESSRLLLNSKSQSFPNGLANNSANVGKNLLFSAGGIVEATFDHTTMPLVQLLEQGYFINRYFEDLYKHKKGGMIEFVFEHANPIRKADRHKWDSSNNLLWGEKLYEKLYEKFTQQRVLNAEIFNDWIPHDKCYVSIDEKHKDKYGVNVARVAIDAHPHNSRVAQHLAKQAIKVFKAMGAKEIQNKITTLPPTNLQAGGCRFGDDAKTSVLNKYCQSHEVKNLFVTDGSFMPTGGSIPYTFTIYANAFRVAQYISQNWEKIV